jgi:AAA ATPase domain
VPKAGDSSAPRSTPERTNVGQSIAVSGVIQGQVVYGQNAMAVAYGSGAARLVLPQVTPEFVGRAAEVDRLEGLLSRAADRTPRVAVISGMAGCGKTALAVHVAHRVARQFPDGALFVAVSPNKRDTHATGDILGDLLGVLGVPTDALPPAATERAAIYGSPDASVGGFGAS